MLERKVEESDFQPLCTFLSSLHFFSNINRPSLERIVRSLSIVSIGGGEIFIHQGAHDPTLYIVLHGRLRVSQGVTDLADLSPGEIVGEIALLLNRPRTADVRAIRDSVVLRLDRATFEQLEVEYPREVVEMAKISLKRTISKPRRTQIGENFTTIAVVHAGSSNHRPFLQRFVTELSKIKSTRLINRDRCDEQFGLGAAQMKLEEDDSIKISRWLLTLEEQQGHIVYECDQGLTPWTERCVRQSDRILLVAEFNSSNRLNVIEQELFASHYTGCIDIVFIHPDEGQKISGTYAWLEKRPVHNYHHLTLGSSHDFAKLNRFLTGNSMGVVLSGGGARGFAHAGVMKAFDELKIPVDFIGGCSAGAVVAAGYARMGAQKVIDLCHSTRKDWQKMDYTLPILSLLKGKRITRLYQQFYENDRIEDLKTHFFCVSSNITQSKQHIHTQGLLWLAVRASTAIPAIYPPVYDRHGNMLVDGSVMDNLPVNVMRRLLGGGKIMAINCRVVKAADPTRQIDTPWVSGWGLLARKYIPFAQRFASYNSIFYVLRTALNLSVNEQAQRMAKEADLFMEIDTNQFKVMKFDKIPEIVEAGYRSAMEQLPKILNL
jgi:predicted acylesterase/phospholipase RssA